MSYNKSPFIYALALDNNVLKIGKSNNISKRLQYYRQTSTKVDPLFISPVTHQQDAENYLKTSLINRIKGQEYFEDCKENRAIIADFKQLNMPTRKRNIHL